MTALELRPEVAAFAQLMEAQLRANDHKPGWKGETSHWLMGRLFEEANELAEARELRHVMDGSLRSDLIGREAADVANFAMMIADVCGALSSEVQPVGSERSDDERSVHADPLDTSRHVDGAGWTVGGLHRPTVDVVLQMMRTHMAEGERMGLKVGTLREAIEDVEWISRQPAALTSPLDTSGRVEGSSVAESTGAGPDGPGACDAQCQSEGGAQ